MEQDYPYSGPPCGPTRRVTVLDWIPGRRGPQPPYGWATVYVPPCGLVLRCRVHRPRLVKPRRPWLPYWRRAEAVGSPGPTVRTLLSWGPAGSGLGGAS